jgi:pilus assembly protein CpaC
MFNINSSKLLKSVPALLLGYTLQAGAEITTSAEIKHLNYEVTLNKSLLINLDRNVSKLTKGNEAIADTTLLAPKQLLLRGNTTGSTNATLWDANDHVAYVVDVTVTTNPTLNDLKKLLKEVLPNESIEVIPSGKCTILKGEVSSLANLDFAMKITQGFVTPGAGSGGSSNSGEGTQINISTASGGGNNNGGGCGDRTGGSAGGGGNASQSIINMMHVGGEQQVMLEVKIAEVSRTLARALTLDSSASKTNAQDGSFIWTALSAGAGLFTGSYVTGNTLFNWTLNFSRNTSLATILAEPNLTTLSGKKAAFNSGGEFPYVANCSATGGACTTSFKKFGVGLEFTPIVLDSNRINLTTAVSVSALSNRANQILATDAATNCTTDLFGTVNCSQPLQSTPSLDSREASTTLELADGQTMSIAGLISENQSNKQEQTPGLADIPLLGSLFRNRTSSNDKKELVILITPHLAKPIPHDQIRLPTENYVPPGDIDFYLLGRMEDRKAPVKTVKGPVFDPSAGGTTGQFGHQINHGDSK